MGKGKKPEGKTKTKKIPAENRVSKRSEKSQELTPEQTKKLSRELQARQTELEMENEKLLREGKVYNRILFDQSIIGLALARMDGQLVDVNEAYAKIIGRTVEETLKLTYWELTPKKYAEQEQLQLESLNSTGKYGPYEKEYIQKEGQLVPVRLQGQIIERGGEKFIWSSVEDITDRKRAELLLSTEKQVLEMIATENPLPEVLETIVLNIESLSPEMIASILLLDEEGTHVHYGAAPHLPFEYNRAIEGAPIGPSAGSCGTAAFRKEQVIVEDIATDPLWQEYRKLALPHGLRACWSTPIINTGGVVLGTFALYYKKPCKPSSFDFELIARTTNLAAIVIQRKRSEEELRRSENQFHSAFKNAAVGMSLNAPAGNFIKVNEALCRMLGYSSDELLNFTMEQITHPEDISISEQYVLRSLEQQEDIFHLIKRFIRKNGETIWAEISSSLIRNTKGEPLYFINLIVDITGRKQAEEKARINQLLFKKIFDLSPLASVVSKLPERIVLDVNPAFEKMFGYTREEIIGKSIMKFDLCANSSERVKLQEMVKNGDLNDCEFQFKTKSGATGYGIYFSTTLDQSIEKYVLVKIFDITERKRSEKSLINSEERLRLSTELANIAVWEYDFLINKMSRSENHDKLYGLDLQEEWKFETFLKATHPDDRDYSNEIIQKSAAVGGPDNYQFDFRVVYPDQSIHWLSVRGEIVERNSNGAGILARGCLFDITDRKKIENELKESEIKYRSFFENSMDAILLTEPDGNINSANPAAAKMLGRTEDEIIKIGRNGIVDLTDTRLPGLLSQRAAHGKVMGELNMLRKDGSRFPAELSSALFTDSSGKVRTSMIIRDITDRKKAEKDIFYSKQLFYEAFHSGPAGMTITRISDGKFIDVNESFLKMFEFSRDEVIGHTSVEVNMLTPEARAKLIEMQLKTGGLKNCELRTQSKSGKIINLLFSSRPLDLTGELCHITTLIDISERKYVEEELQKSKTELELLAKHLETAREQERRRISRELHDELGQALTAIKIDLKMALQSKDEKSKDQKLNDLLEITSQTIKEVQRISTQLRPSILDDLGLIPALEWYCSDFQKRTNINLQIDLEELALKDPQKNIAIFRVVQESFTNIARHSEAKNAWVKLNAVNGGLELIIRDDGIGFPEEKMTILGSLGLIGMRERLNHVNGKFEIRSEINKGTTVSVFVPIEE